MDRHWWKRSDQIAERFNLLGQIDLYLFCYYWSEDFLKIIDELRSTDDLDNIKLALAMLENTENKILKDEKWKLI